MQGIALLLVLQHACIGGTELCFVESLAVLLGGLLHLFVNLLVVLCQLVLYQHVGAVALLAVLVVNQGIVEGVHVSAGLPYGGVHENGGIDTHDVLVEQYHGLPPVLLDVVLQFNAVLAIVVHCAQTVVYVA